MVAHITFCAQAQYRKQSFNLAVHNALITHQGTDYLLVTHSQSVRHLISLRLLIVLNKLPDRLQ